jgi:hypothetical protein
MKNPHVKIPPKSPCANFQSLGIFKNQILFGKEFSRHFRPIRPFGPAAAHFFSFQPPVSPPPLPTGPRPLGQPSPTSRPNRPPSSSSRTGAKRARSHRSASRRPHGRPRRLHRKKKKWPHQSPFIPQLISAISPSSKTDNQCLQLGPLKLLQRRPLKAPLVKTPTPPTLPLLALNVPSPSPFRTEAPPPVRRPSTASRATTTPPLSSSVRPSSPPPLGRSSRAPEWPEAKLR